MVMPASMKLSITVPGVRRRVYVLGIISVLMAVGQVIGYLVILSLVLTPEHSDGQVATVCVGMTVLTSCYLGLTARLLFLFHERRYEETKGPEWLWWFCTMGVIIFNCLLVVWFALLPDPVPAAACALSILIYFLSFKFAKDDLKFLRDDAASVTAVPIITTTASAIKPQHSVEKS